MAVGARGVGEREVLGCRECVGARVSTRVQSAVRKRERAAGVEYLSECKCREQMCEREQRAGAHLVDGCGGFGNLGVTYRRSAKNFPRWVKLSG